MRGGGFELTVFFLFLDSSIWAGGSLEHLACVLQSCIMYSDTCKRNLEQPRGIAFWEISERISRFQSFSTNISKNCTGDLFDNFMIGRRQ